TFWSCAATHSCSRRTRIVRADPENIYPDKTGVSGIYIYLQNNILEILEGRSADISPELDRNMTIPAFCTMVSKFCQWIYHVPALPLNVFLTLL
ncbi:MAG: hypothetical protein M3O22_05810, partial [Pseudomonadota bacterium]|nr:hypothetical protein [Pseudomonadota bacterium]